MSEPTIKAMEFETEIGPGSVSVENGEVRIEQRPNPELAQILAVGFVDMMREFPAAKNYLEILLTDERDGRRITVTVQYIDGETPGEAAARRTKTAEAAVDLCEELIGYTPEYFRSKYDYDQELGRLKQEVDQ